MPNSISRRLGYEGAYTFWNSISTPSPDALVGYIMLGKSVSWNLANDVPPAIYDTENTMFTTYNNFLGGKRVTGNDIALVIPRVNWTANVVYTQYDDQSNTQFTSANAMYVYSSAGNVYKCLNNANNGPSTIEPAGNYTSANGFVSPGDGYTWKYMYKVPPTSQFLTSTWIPVPVTQTPAYFGFANNVVVGALSRLQVTANGAGYFQVNTAVLVTGSGIGANGAPTVTTGNLVSVALDAHGSGYTRQNVKVTVVGAGSNAAVRPILSPYGGHGFNPARELGANNVMLSVKIGFPDATEGATITANNDFRQVGVLLRPNKYGQNVAVTSANANIAVTMVTQLLLTSGPGYISDELVYQGASVAAANFTANVSDIFTNAVELCNVNGSVIVGSSLTGNTSGTVRTVIAISNPDLDEESGDLVFTDNRVPVMRTPGQSQVINIVLNF
jgi:hypothetical protein